MIRWLLGLLVFASLGCAARAQHGLPPAEVEQMEPELKASYALFSVKCARCHTLDRALDADIVDFSHWQNYVARMRKQPGSGISAAHGDRILVFLKHLAEQKTAARTASVAVL